MMVIKQAHSKMRTIHWKISRRKIQKLIGKNLIMKMVGTKLSFGDRRAMNGNQLSRV